MVLVDSDDWFRAFRRGKPTVCEYVARLSRLVERGEVAMIGLIRQEVLSGIRSRSQFGTLRRRLRAFPDEAVTSDLHELAAAFFGHCRSHGLQGSHTDFLLCACAVSWKMRILSADNDFRNYSRYIPIDLEIP
jgi:predicted nucleic acid-binding protein